MDPQHVFMTNHYLNAFIGFIQAKDFYAGHEYEYFSNVNFTVGCPIPVHTIPGSGQSFLRYGFLEAVWFAGDAYTPDMRDRIAFFTLKHLDLP